MKMIQSVNTQSNPRACDDELKIQRSDWATLQSRPGMNDGGQVIWQDLMTALGHTSTLSTKHRAPNHAQTQAFCWLGSARIQHLAVSSANFLSARHLHDLCMMTSAIGIQIWLLYDIEPCDEKLGARLQLDARSCDVDEFLAAREKCNEHAPIVVQGDGLDLPDTHFLEFLECAIRSVQNEPDKQAFQTRILKHFHQGREEMLQAISEKTEIDEDQVALILHSVTAHTNNVNDVISLVKGAQVAAFLSGWNLKVDITRWLQRGKFSSLSSTLDESEWSSLSRIQSPCIVAAATLSVLGISSDDMPEIDISAIGDHATTIVFNGNLIAVPEPAQELLQVQLHYRNLVGSHESPYLVQGPKEAIVSPRWAGEVMRNATKETGVALRAWDASRKSIEQGPWTLRSGISVARFTS